VFDLQSCLYFMCSLLILVGKHIK